jgi:hypothetical protein
MKWHVIFLVTILLLAMEPITAADLPSADHEYSGPTFRVPGAAPHADLWGLHVWTCWSAVVAAYGACPGRVTLCRWQLVLRWRPTSPRKRRQAKGGTPAPAAGAALTSSPTFSPPVQSEGLWSKPPTAETAVGWPGRPDLREPWSDVGQGSFFSS